MRREQSCPCGCGCRLHVEVVVVGESPCKDHDLPLAGALDHIDSLNKHCYRCGHDWTSTQPTPTICPRCKSRWWYVAGDGPMKPGRRAGREPALRKAWP